MISGSPYVQSIFSFGALSSCCNKGKKLDMVSMVLSSMRPSIGPKEHYRTILPLSAVTDWHLIVWTILFPSYKTYCFLPCLQTLLTVPSTNPKKLFKGAPSFEVHKGHFRDLQRIVNFGWMYATNFP